MRSATIIDGYMRFPNQRNGILFPINPSFNFFENNFFETILNDHKSEEYYLCGFLGEFELNDNIFLFFCYTPKKELYFCATKFKHMFNEEEYFGGSMHLLEQPEFIRIVLMQKTDNVRDSIVSICQDLYFKKGFTEKKNGTIVGFNIKFEK